ncbi:uncharacterized protein LOC108597654 [Drosophila busckii]|uniref:uncharacterized protein LOC108597654 n=1 Tax=Drosophila busckii TaxID=30019 RepID=UPI00083EFF28|nr:uncharacterized protein LOC108597654 [Drosophila busckii]
MPSQIQTALNFQIKLLSGNNVVLVDCKGYESELFMPQIVKGRITFQNIIPNHRCCDSAAANVKTDQLILPAYKLGDVRIIAGAGTPQRFNYDQQNISSPLARSTPSSGTSVRVLPRLGKENAGALLTPELARCRPTQQITPVDALQLERSSSVSQLQAAESPMLPINESTQSPLQAPSTSSSLTSETTLCNFMHKAPPARTYSRRRPSGTSHPRQPISWSPLAKKKKNTKVSSTKPPSPNLKLEVRQRKLIVDNKKTLAPHELQKSIPMPITKQKIRRKQVTGKTRQQFDALKVTAYDLLTTPGHGQVSKELQKQFKDACIDKYSDTLPNYAALSKTTPLQLDRQVKSLMAKQRRLDKQMTKSQQANLLKKK